MPHLFPGSQAMRLEADGITYVHSSFLFIKAGPFACPACPPLMILVKPENSFPYLRPSLYYSGSSLFLKHLTTLLYQLLLYGFSIAWSTHLHYNVNFYATIFWKLTFINFNYKVFQNTIFLYKKEDSRKNKSVPLNTPPLNQLFSPAVWFVFFQIYFYLCI